MARQSRNRQTGDAADRTNASGREEERNVPPVGHESVTTEGSHRLISNGDGTARQVPIVNGNGEYPPRPVRDDDDNEE